MALMTWDDSYSVQIPSIDAQHKKLFVLINQLHEAMSKGKATAVMGGILGELLAYTKNHFRDEEKLLQSKNYPDLKAHQAQHGKFVDKVTKLQNDFASGHLAVSVEVMTFLRDWLSQHILKTDKRYSQFLNGNSH